MNREDFAKRLHELRQRQKLTQKALAARAGVVPDTIYRLERGKFSPSLDTLNKLAEGLGLETVALIVDNYDEADALAHLIRELPEMERQVAYSVLGALRVHAAVDH